LELQSELAAEGFDPDPIASFHEETPFSTVSDWHAQTVEDSFFPGTGTRVASSIIPTYLCPSDDSGTQLGDRAFATYAASRGPTSLAVNPDCPCQIPWQTLALAPLDVRGISPVRSLAWESRVHDRPGDRRAVRRHVFFGETRPRCSQIAQNGWASSNDGNGYCSTLIPINFDTCNDDAPDPCNRTFNWNAESGFKSLHPAGADFLFGDGAVRFVPDTIDHKAYQYLGAKATGRRYKSISNSRRVAKIGLE